MHDEVEKERETTKRNERRGENATVRGGGARETLRTTIDKEREETNKNIAAADYDSTHASTFSPKLLVLIH